MPKPGELTFVAPRGAKKPPRHLADLTPAAAAELELAPGREVWLSTKATAVSRYPARR